MPRDGCGPGSRVRLVTRTCCRLRGSCLSRPRPAALSRAAPHTPGLDTPQSPRRPDSASCAVAVPRAVARAVARAMAREAAGEVCVCGSGAADEAVGGGARDPRRRQPPGAPSRLHSENTRVAAGAGAAGGPAAPATGNNLPKRACFAWQLEQELREARPRLEDAERVSHVPPPHPAAPPGRSARGAGQRVGSRPATRHRKMTRVNDFTAQEPSDGVRGPASRGFTPFWRLNPRVYTGPACRVATGRRRRPARQCPSPALSRRPWRGSARLLRTQRADRTKPQARAGDGSGPDGETRTCVSALGLIRRLAQPPSSAV